MRERDVSSVHVEKSLSNILRSSFAKKPKFLQMKDQKIQDTKIDRRTYIYVYSNMNGEWTNINFEHNILLFCVSVCVCVRMLFNKFSSSSFDTCVCKCLWSVNCRFVSLASILDCVSNAIACSESDILCVFISPTSPGFGERAQNVRYFLSFFFWLKHLAIVWRFGHRVDNSSCSPPILSAPSFVLGPLWRQICACLCDNSEKDCDVHSHLSLTSFNFFLFRRMKMSGCHAAHTKHSHNGHGYQSQSDLANQQQ